ncbi:MAG: ABC transporter substrate-binding protein [Jatrophihabitantaceae bacterium]
MFSPPVVGRLGRDLGLFADHGIDLREHRVSSSMQAFQDLADGSYDLLLTNPDNVLAYRISAANPVGRRLDVHILMGVDRGLGLSLFAAPGIESLADLRGRTVGVDAAATGFAFTLYALMHRRGMQVDRDYECAEIGTTPIRRKILVAGDCAATMLNAGQDWLAEDGGCRRLVRVRDELGPYLGAVLVARESWTVRNVPLVDRLRTAWREANSVALDPTRASTVTAAIGAMLGCGPDVAERARQTLMSPAEGLIADGVIDPAHLQTVIDLRAAYSGSDDAPRLRSAAIADSGLLWRA